VLEATFVETRKQHAGVRVIQSLNVSITTIGMETVVTPNIDIIRRGVVIGFATKLGIELGGVLVGRNLSQSLVLPVATTRVVGILQMVFTNPITATHGNKIANQPLMSSMAVRRCKSVDVMHSKKGY